MIRRMFLPPGPMSGADLVHRDLDHDHPRGVGRQLAGRERGRSLVHLVQDEQFSRDGPVPGPCLMMSTAIPSILMSSAGR